MAPATARGNRTLLVALAGMATFLATQAALHFIFWGENPRHISSYVHLGSLSEALWHIGIAGLAAGLAALAFVVHLRLPRTQNSRLATLYLAVATLTVLALSIFPTDRSHLPSSPNGYLHDAAALTTVVSLCAAMLLMVECGRVDSRWQAVAGSSTTIPVTATILGFGWGLMDLTPFEVASEVLQRILTAYLVGWFLVVAWRLREQGLPGAAAPGTDAVKQPAR